MPFPTRQQLIQARRWRLETIDGQELGPLTLAKPSAAFTLRVQKLREDLAAASKDHQSTDGAILELVAEILVGLCVDADGCPMFGCLDDARVALASVTMDAARAIIDGFVRLTTPP